MKMKAVLCMDVALWLFLMCLVPTRMYSMKRFGDVSPSMPYKFVNETLVLNCTLHSSSTDTYNASRLFFEFNDATMEDYVTRLDNRTIQLKKVMITASDAGLYSCLLRIPSVGNEYVGSQDVQVEYAPHAVKINNTSCVVFNWDEGMRCDWDIGIYVHEENVAVAVMYYIFRDPNSYPCPDAGRTYCYWNADNFRAVYAYYVAVTVTNLKTNVSNSSHIPWFITNSVVQPANVIDLKEVHKNTSCIEISWSHSKIKTRPLIFRIKIKPSADGGPNWKLVSDKLPKTTTKFTVCQLLPYTSYVLAVDCKPGKKGFWSNETLVEITTAEDVPGSGPHVSKGSFMRHDSCGEQGIQNVTLFWQDDFEKNGVITGYQIEYDGRVEDVAGDVTMYTVSMLLCNTSHPVQIFAQTSAGISRNYSQIFIPQVEKVPPIPKKLRIVIDKTNQDDEDVHAVWERTSPSVTNFTVYWCRGLEIPCKGSIKWKTVGNETETRLPIKGSVAADYLFGISAEMGNISSGYVGDSCVVYKYGKPMLPPESVKIDTLTNGPQLTVTWESSWCLKKEKVFIVQFVVHYCEVPNCTEMKTATVDGDRTSLTLSKLSLGVNYSVQVQAVSQAGSSPLSKPVFGVTHETSSRFDWIPVIGAVIAIFVLLFIILMCFSGVNRKKICHKLPISYPKDLHKNEVNYSNGQVYTSQSEPNSPDHLLPAQDNSNTTQTTIVEIVKDSGRGSLPSSQRENGHLVPDNDEILYVDLNTGDAFLKEPNLPRDSPNGGQRVPQRISQQPPNNNSLSDYVTVGPDNVALEFTSARKEGNDAIQNSGYVANPQNLANADTQSSGNADLYLDSPDVVQGIPSPRPCVSCTAADVKSSVASARPSSVLEGGQGYCEVSFSSDAVPKSGSENWSENRPLSISGSAVAGPGDRSKKPVEGSTSLPTGHPNSFALLDLGPHATEEGHNRRELRSQATGEVSEKPDSSHRGSEEDLQTHSPQVSDYVMAADDPSVMLDSKL
ncbi:uncharacterized protein LOC121375965 [Gigantopelta aegis]|uniref:uncharacterized protein LOC121375965 n=1 Tax=Gigantopelta aegis TaxID=1735272 RepID=UPI001B888AB6|nr:uncharacterized protein LOC121375965 [Gigantopelta aegis]